MNRVFLIARQEFLANIRRRSFLFSAFGLPIIIIAVQLAAGAFVEQQSKSTGKLGQVGYVDLTPDGILTRALNKPPEFIALPNQELALSAIVSGQVGAFFVVPEDYMRQGVVHAYSINDIPRGIETQMATFLADNLLADWPTDHVDRLRNPANLATTTLRSKHVISEETSVGAILVPFIFALLFLMAIFSTSGLLMQGVVEEKENRLVEILITSITSLQILWGKILGLGALGLVQVTVWIAAGALLLSQGSSLWSGLADIRVPTRMLVLAPVYLLLGYLVFGALLAGIGASVTSLQEAQQIAGIVSLLAVLPLILSFAFLDNANGPVPTILSLVPFTAPVAMVMRLPFADVPVWQIALSLLVLAAMAFLIVWIAAQVFRVGLLMYGKRLGLGALLMAVREGTDVTTENVVETQA